METISPRRITPWQITDQLHCMPLRAGDWQPKALTLSGMTGTGLDEIWQLIIAHRDALLHSKGLERLRARQRRKWMWAMVQDELTRKIERLKKENDVVNLVETDLHQSKITAAMGAEIIIKQLGFKLGSGFDYSFVQERHAFTIRCIILIALLWFKFRVCPRIFFQISDFRPQQPIEFDSSAW